MVFGCISKNFPENIFWCLEKKKENKNQKMQNNTNQKNTSHKSRKTQIQNNTSKLRLVHSNIFTENASNQKPKPSKRNATSSSIAPTSGARPTSALVARRWHRSSLVAHHTGRRSSLVAPRSHRSSLVVDSFSFAGFWFLLPDLMHFL